MAWTLTVVRSVTGCKKAKSSSVSVGKSPWKHSPKCELELWLYTANKNIHRKVSPEGETRKNKSKESLERNRSESEEDYGFEMRYPACFK